MTQRTQAQARKAEAQYLKTVLAQVITSSERSVTMNTRHAQRSWLRGWQGEMQV